MLVSLTELCIRKDPDRGMQVSLHGDQANPLSGSLRLIDFYAMPVATLLV